MIHSSLHMCIVFHTGIMKEHTFKNAKSVKCYFLSMFVTVFHTNNKFIMCTSHT